LNRNQLLDVNDLPHKEVEVPEWGGAVRLITLGARDRVEWERAAFPEGKDVDVEQYVAGLLLRTIVGEDNKPLLMAEDLDVLANRNPVILRRLQSEALALNGLGPAKAKELEKNSEATPADVSTSS
jgi:hypothetical protein